MVWIRRFDVPVALSIAGSDSGGGAGIEADLKAFAAVGVHGAIALTALTAQNSTGVFGVFPVSPDFVFKQIEVVFEDMGINAAKTGMLFNSEIISAVCEAIDKFKFPVVVDPVMIAKSGAPLLKDDAIDTLISELIPRALIVTPNVFEAERIYGSKISNIADAEHAAKEISKLGVKAVVIKGGHLSGDESTDILFYRGRTWRFSLPRLNSKNTHGTGCCFSAAIAGYLAKGFSIVEAVKRAKELTYYAIMYGLPVGKGVGSVNPLAITYLDSERFRVLRDLEEGFNLLRNLKGISDLIPQCRSNFVYALPDAVNVYDVAGFPGRISVINGKLVAFSPPKFGGSDHVARIILTAIKYDPNIRSAINLKYSEDIVNAAIKAGLKVSMFDRALEPTEIKKIEGMSLPWGVKTAIEEVGFVPDIIYDRGGFNREAMVRVLGKDPYDIVKKVKAILREL